MNPEKVEKKINNLLDEIIKDATNRMKSSKVLRVNYNSEEMEKYIAEVEDLKESFNETWGKLNGDKDTFKGEEDEG
ncbi:MAG: hypothetical protein Q8N08_05150 [Methanobacteriaceae archaeon]|nr:hypothetical protein [Methanobacteriaceae archaeon]